MNKEFANSFREYQRTGNAWLDLAPLSKLIICMCIGLSAIVVMDWRYGFPLCLVYILGSVYTKTFKKFIKMIAAVVLTILVMACIIRQIGHRDGNVTVMFSIFGWKWYKESFISALNLVSYIAGFSGAIIFYFNTTEMRDLMYNLERRGVGHETSYIMLSSMQSIIDLRKSANTILESQQCRGIETQGNVFVRTKAFFPILAPVMLSAMSGTEEKAIAMDAGAFSRKGEHTFLRELKPVGTGEKIFVALSILYLVACIAWKVLSATGVI